MAAGAGDESAGMSEKEKRLRRGAFFIRFDLFDSVFLFDLFGCTEDANKMSALPVYVSA